MIDSIHRHIKRGRTDVMACELNLCIRSPLRRQTDWAVMAHSAETRTPLVDSELFSGLAPALVSFEPLTKSDFVAVATPRLPSAVLTRPKAGFEVPIAAGRGGQHSPGWGKYVCMRATAPAPNANA